MENKPSPQEVPNTVQTNPPSNPPNVTTTDKLLASPDIQKAIAQIPDLIRANIEAQYSVTKSMTKGTIFLAGFITAIVVLAVVLLASWDKLSSDAVGIVIGAVVGATFTFLSKSFFSGGGE